MPAMLATLSDAGFSTGPPTQITSTVLDTFDGRLYEAGLRLERRDASLLLVAADGAVAHLHIDGEPRVAADLPPGPFRARLAEVAEVRALLPVATIAATCRRIERRNSDGKVVAAVDVLDDLVVDGRQLGRWLVELTELVGYAKPADEARRLVFAHVVDPESVDGVDRLLAAAGVERSGRHIDPGVALDPQQPAVEGYRLVLANLAEAIELNRPGTIDDLDPEFLHDLRVAVRRSRSVLRHGRNVLAADLLAWAEPALRDVGQLTSLPRDLDVQLHGWDAQVAPLGVDDVSALEPLRRQLVTDRAGAYQHLGAELRDGDAARQLARWSDAVHSPMDPAAAGPRGADPLVKVVRRRIRKAQRRMVDHGRAIHADTPGEQLHEVRKDAKKLRYLLECFADLFQSDERKVFVKRLKRLQDLLGEHQDADVQAAELRTAASELPPGTPPETFVAIGRLIERLEEQRRTTREGFAARFAEYDSAPTRQAFRALLEGAGS